MQKTTTMKIKNEHKQAIRKIAKQISGLSKISDPQALEIILNNTKKQLQGGK